MTQKGLKCKAFSLTGVYIYTHTEREVKGSFVHSQCEITMNLYEILKCLIISSIASNLFSIQVMRLIVAYLLQFITIYYFVYRYDKKINCHLLI